MCFLYQEEFPIYRDLCVLLVPYMHSSLHYQHLPRECLFLLLLMSPHWPSSYPKSTVNIRVHSWQCTFYRFGQIIMTCIYHCVSYRVFSLRLNILCFAYPTPHNIVLVTLSIVWLFY